MWHAGAVTKRVHDRYRAGERRTSAEPLAASWRPGARPSKKAPKPKRGLLATYGWRVYAVPVLIAITALVVIQTAGDDGKGAAAAQDGQAEENQDTGDVQTTGPGVSEKPAKPQDLKIPTADLPPGADFPKSGQGSWTVLPGTTKKWGLLGMINMTETPGGRSAGSLFWAGLCNSYYWVDWAKGNAGVLFTQILPFADPQVLDLFERFENTARTL